jgi:dihydropteroate synthase
VTNDLRHATGVLPTASRPIVMGVLNVTPDSFSDGGRALARDGGPERAIELGLALTDDGADCIDVGGESTRPGADPVPIDVELARVVPVVTGLVAQGVLVSIDTRHAEVARVALDAGATIVNDVGALASDGRMLEVVAAAGAAYVIMHLRGEPRTMQDDPRFDDVVRDVTHDLRVSVDRAVEAGVAPDAIAIDPGIGFGKTFEHNLALLAALPGLVAIGPPVLVGTSRKSFLGRLTGVEEPSQRLAGSLASAVLAARDGARILRVHDVRETVEALAVQQAVDAYGGSTRAVPGSASGTVPEEAQGER